MTWRRLFPKALLVVVLLILLGCSHTGVPGEIAGRSQSQPYVEGGGKMFDSIDINTFPVLGHLKTRDKFITIRCGAGGPYYTIKDHDGNTISVNIPDSKLRAKFPWIHGIMEGGVAKDVSWAGL
ncbi:hypothetical protein ACFL47_01860 [Candidatus Latescibacterota bacterium]